MARVLLFFFCLISVVNFNKLSLQCCTGGITINEIKV
jgi:hypothetical protein